jgi:hypothetical protein
MKASHLPIARCEKDNNKAEQDAARRWSLIATLSQPREALALSARLYTRAAQTGMTRFIAFAISLALVGEVGITRIPAAESGRGSDLLRSR